MKRIGLGRSISIASFLVCQLVFVSGCGGSEARKERYVENGKALMEQRDYTKAQLEFRNALQIDPKDAEARALAGFAAEQLGDYEDAVKMYRLAIAGNPALVLPRARLGRILALAGLPDQAMETIAPGLEKSPNSAELLSVRAIIYSQQGDMNAARRDAEAAVAADPADENANWIRAALLWREGERDEAINFLTGAVARNPSSVELHRYLGLFLTAVEKPAEAEVQLAEVVRLEPRKIEHRYQLARLLLLQGKSDKAVEVLRGAVESNPSSVDAKLALLQLLVATRSFDEAEKQIAAFEKESPRDFALRIGIGDLYLTSGRDQQAEKTYQQIVEEADKGDQRTSARNRLAALRVRDGRLDDASKLVGLVLEENPSDADALAIRADISIRRGDPAAAVSDLRVAFGNQPDSVPLAVALARAHVAAGEVELAEQTLRSVVASSPRDVQARLELAQFLVDRGRLQQARPVLEQLVAEQPNNLLALEGLTRLQTAAQDTSAALKNAETIQALQPKSSKGYLLAGQIEQAAKRLEDARRSFERAATVDPNSPDPVLALVRLDVAEGRPASALERVDAALQRTPSSGVLLSVRGDLLMGIGKPADAAVSYEAAAKAVPGWAQPYRSLAMAYEAAGQRDQAVAALRSGLAATRQSPSIAMDLALLQMQMGKVDDAITTYEAMLDRNPRDMAVANNLAMLLANYRSDEASLERAERLVKPFADSDDAGFLDTYGWVLYRRGRAAEAVVALDAAVKKVPQSQEIRYHLGMAQLKTGKKDEARRNLELATAGSPGFTGVEEARKALAEM